MVEQLRDNGITVLLVTHYADEAERLCDRVALIQSGRLAAAGTPADLISRASASRAGYPGTPVNLDDAIVALTTGAES
jgi:ABC-2 type transport system ATP-binding protein